MKTLLAVDGSEYTKRMLAYLAAHDELRLRDEAYTIINVVLELPPLPFSHIGPGVLETYYNDEAETVLKPVLAFAAQQGWEVEVLRKHGRAGEVIAQTADAGRFDLVVMGSHGHSGLGGLVLGSTTQQVLARCKVPVLIIR